jgi:hypothetical protein
MRIDPINHDYACRAISRHDFVLGELWRHSRSKNFFIGTTKSENACLSKSIAHQHVVVGSNGIVRLGCEHNITSDNRSSLVNELIERVLSIRSWFTPIDRTSLGTNG